MSKSKSKTVYQFKITLKGTKPPVWRRIQVPASSTFYDFHAAIQDAMGWDDSHLHEFMIQRPKDGQMVNIGIPDDEDGMFAGFGSDALSERKHKLSQYFTVDNTKAQYIYDFGDDWIHAILFEGEFPADETKSYPLCLKGKRACPPEDCGGVWGYQDLVEGNSELQEEYEDYDPAHFDPSEVVFRNAKPI